MRDEERVRVLAVALADRVVMEGCRATFNDNLAMHDTVGHQCILEQAFELMQAVIDDRREIEATI